MMIHCGDCTSWHQYRDEMNEYWGRCTVYSTATRDCFGCEKGNRKPALEDPQYYAE
ncbi:hypothetical protein LCGC14_0717880 [marine sediment metagenome]|uniref:Uncharacterized protein n=1 Tax=marine sediment metagenome TaxID=412755 RepID=A0A0F9QHK0_9ZZZZ